MELAEKIEFALVAYLQTKTYPDYFVASDQVKPGESDEDLAAQYVRCWAAENAEAETPQSTGNFWYQAEVEVRTPTRIQTDADLASSLSTDSTSQLDKHQAVAAVVEDAILIDDLPEVLTAAGTDFHVFAVHDRQPTRAQNDEVYSSGILLRLYCCSLALV